MGQMTFPHRFMPLLLLEQLYRARDLSLDEGTDLTRALVDNRLKYRVYDFSTENYELMQRKRRAAIAASTRSQLETQAHPILPNAA